MMMQKHALYLILMLILAGMSAAPLVAQPSSDQSFDGLERVTGSNADQLWVLPGADFSGYQRVSIESPSVAFADNWSRNMNRSASLRVRSGDMERIRAGMAEIFLEVFAEELENAGYTMTDETGEDVLVLRPAIVDLYVNAPDVQTPGRNRTYVTTAGSARLVLEVHDSVSGAILARAVDFRRARESARLEWTTSVSNRQAAREVTGRWARMVVQALDEAKRSDP